MHRSTSFQRLAIVSAIGLMLLVACRAPFQVRVTDLRGGARPYFYEGESLKMHVHWGQEARDMAVICQVLDTYRGETKWQGRSTVPNVETGSLEVLSFDPPLPLNGQLGLTRGGYRWICELEDAARSSVYFDIIER